MRPKNVTPQILVSMSTWESHSGRQITDCCPSAISITPVPAPDVEFCLAGYRPGRRLMNHIRGGLGTVSCQGLKPLAHRLLHRGLPHSTVVQKQGLSSSPVQWIVRHSRRERVRRCLTAETDFHLPDHMRKYCWASPSARRQQVNK